jgi:hypothetical protein
LVVLIGMLQNRKEKKCTVILKITMEIRREFD